MIFQVDDSQFKLYATYIESIVHLVYKIDKIGIDKLWYTSYKVEIVVT